MNTLSDQALQTPGFDAELFPAITRKSTGYVNGIFTDILFVTFADKLLFTICQNGRLAHWVR